MQREEGRADPPARRRDRPPYLAAFSRHAGDAVRVVLAMALLVLTALPVTRAHVPVLEEHAFRLVNDLPGFLFPLVWAVMQLGNLLAVPVAAGLALVARRWRLALGLVLSGGSAWVAAKVIKRLFDRDRPLALLDDVAIRGAAEGGLGYVSGHAAVAAALAAAVTPCLGRRLRRVVWGLAVTVALARMYVGVHLPLDVVGGAALGWGVAAGVHLLLGAPGGRPSPVLVAQVLGSMGLPVDDVRPAAGAGRSSVPFRATTADGRALFVKVVSRERRDLDLLHRGWRRLVSRWFREKAVLASPRERVHHEAALALLAGAAGVRTPPVVAVTTFGNGAGLLVQRCVDGATLDHLAPTAVDDDLLRAVWSQVALLRRAGIAHGNLTADNVVVDGERRPWVVDFAGAEAGVGPGAVRLDQDVAELLASLSGLVGPARAVASAADALGRGALAAVPAFLKGARRSGESPSVRRARDRLLPALGAELDPPTAAAPSRRRPEPRPRSAR